MPVVSSSFTTVGWLQNGHLQTLLAPCRHVRHSRFWCPEVLELPDGDFLLLEWLTCGAGRLAVLGHGMEGSSRSVYVRGLGQHLSQAGWDVLAWNLRGCGGVENRLPGWYHAGQTEDLHAVLRRAGEGYREVVVVGFSLGGNLLLKYLGEGDVHPAVRAAVAVSAPLDLEASARVLDGRFSNRLYLKNFLRSFEARIARKRALFPEKFRGRPSSLGSIREFDAAYTAPLNGFADVTAYWQACSASRFLSGIRIPALILNARDDPFLSSESFPEEEAVRSDFFWLETPRHGGHVAFLDLADGLRPWWEGRVRAFLELAVAADLVSGTA
jgi:predicted alpha/beta-fold hydrolase